jgi:hypothetical protein
MSTSDKDDFNSNQTGLPVRRDRQKIAPLMMVAYLIKIGTYERSGWNTENGRKVSK